MKWFVAPKKDSDVLVIENKIMIRAFKYIKYRKHRNPLLFFIRKKSLVISVEYEKHNGTTTWDELYFGPDDTLEIIIANDFESSKGKLRNLKEVKHL